MRAGTINICRFDQCRFPLQTNAAPFRQVLSPSVAAPFIYENVTACRYERGTPWLN